LTHVVSKVSIVPSCSRMAAAACAALSVTVVRNQATPSKPASAGMPASFHDPAGVMLDQPRSS
jgi:hypothetical protein